MTPDLAPLLARIEKLSEWLLGNAQYLEDDTKAGGWRSGSEPPEFYFKEVAERRQWAADLRTLTALPQPTGEDAELVAELLKYGSNGHVFLRDLGHAQPAMLAAAARLATVSAELEGAKRKELALKRIAEGDWYNAVTIASAVLATDHQPSKDETR